MLGCVQGYESMSVCVRVLVWTEDNLVWFLTLTLRQFIVAHTGLATPAAELGRQSQLSACSGHLLMEPSFQSLG